jgi:O-antigen/teichoic acid export membrane protein
MSERSSLRTRAVKSAAWYGATRLWGQLISWAVTVLLARLLAPEDYGLYAIALSVLAMVELLQEFGLGTALIQRQDLTRAQVSAVFWVVASTSLLLTGLTMVAAGAISRIYGEPGLAWPLRLLCLTFLLNSLGTVPYSLLTKNINLRRRSLAEAFGVTASALVALSLAYLGFGVVALVVGHLARAVVLNVGLAFFAGWAPTLEVDFRGMRKLLSFGMSVAGSQLVATFTTTTNTFVIARLLSSTAVGLFSMAQAHSAIARAPMPRADPLSACARKSRCLTSALPICRRTACACSANMPRISCSRSLSPIVCFDRWARSIGRARLASDVSPPGIEKATFS